MQELVADHAAEGLQFFAAAQGNATGNQHGAPARCGGGSSGGPGPRAFNQMARHGQQPVGGIESNQCITIRLSRATVDAIISAR
jgi:hypothetical protein